MTISGVHWDRSAIVTVMLCFALNMVDGMDVMIMSYLAPALQRQWGASPAELSLAFSAGLAGMGLGGLGLAPLADRFGRRRLILIALIAMALGTLASSQTHTVPQLAAARFVVGSGIGTVLACIAAIAARVAPERHRIFAVGILQAGYPIGGMLTAFATAAALPHLGWRGVMIGSAATALLMLPLAWRVLPRAEPAINPSDRAGLARTIAGSRLRSSILLWIATICGFMALYFIASWITRLAIGAGLPETQAIIASALYNLGAFTGTVGMSIAGTRFDIRRIAATLLAATAGVFLIFGGVAMPLVGVLAVAFVTGVTLQGGFNALYPIAARVYPDDVRATGIGWAMGIGRIGAFTGPLIGGLALGAHLPLVAVFGIFCIPLLIAAIAAGSVRFAC